MHRFDLVTLLIFFVLSALPGISLASSGQIFGAAAASHDVAFSCSGLTSDGVNLKIYGTFRSVKTSDSEGDERQRMQRKLTIQDMDMATSQVLGDAVTLPAGKVVIGKSKTNWSLLAKSGRAAVSIAHPDLTSSETKIRVQISKSPAISRELHYSLDNASCYFKILAP